MSKRYIHLKFDILHFQWTILPSNSIIKKVRKARLWLQIMELVANWLIHSEWSWDGIFSPHESFLSPSNQNQKTFFWLFSSKLEDFHQKEKKMKFTKSFFRNYVKYFFRLHSLYLSSSKFKIEHFLVFSFNNEVLLQQSHKGWHLKLTFNKPNLWNPSLQDCIIAKVA